MSSLSSGRRQAVLTKKQFQILSFLHSFLQNEGYCPSFEEIGKKLGLSSVATVHKHICALERKGYIRRGQNRSRSIEVVGIHQSVSSSTSREGIYFIADEKSDVLLPLLGRIAAGKLKEFAKNEKVFVLQVKGDSMIDDHICNGDFVLVEKTLAPSQGDTVVALFENGEATLKKYFSEKDGIIRLQPANTSMQPFYVPEQDLRIQGRVIAVLRKY